MEAAIPFGRHLRHLRQRAKVSMGQLARHIDVSVPYLSDVERGARMPLALNRIASAAEFLGLNREEIEMLHALAGDARGVYRFPVRGVASIETGCALARVWPKLTDAQFAQLREFLGTFSV